MPKLDGTGPSNQQAGMIGRGNGNCQYNQQKFGIGYRKCNGIRNGKVNGQGLAFGFRHGQSSSSNIKPLVKDELTFLKNIANNIENNLNNVKNRISELEQDKQ